MNVKKRLAALLALVLCTSGLTTFAGSAEDVQLFGDIDGSGVVDSTDAGWILRYAADVGSGKFTGTLEVYVERNGQPMPKTITDGGDVLTIASWNNYDLKNMIEVFHQDNPDIAVEYVNCGANSGSGANEKYQSFLNSGDGVDMFIAESGWILNYINDDNYAVPLSELGITEADYTDAYDYTVDIGTDNNGVLKAASWQATPGGYCYNADIAEQYLGITTPEEMQAKISSWDGFAAMGAELSEATDGTVTVAASLDDIWQCYATSTNSPWLIDGKVNTQTAREFTEMIVPYVQNQSIDITVAQWGEYDWMVLGKEEGTLGYFFSTWCLTAGNQLEQICGAEGNWRLVQGPQEYFWGGSWLCVSPNCDNKTEAAEFIRYFTSDAESMEKYALASGDFINNKSVMEKVAESDYSNPLLGGQNQFAVLKDAAANIKLNETITPYDEDLKLSLRLVLHSQPMYSAIYDGNIDAVVEGFIEEAKNTIPELFPEEENTETE